MKTYYMRVQFSPSGSAYTNYSKYSYIFVTACNSYINQKNMVVQAPCFFCVIMMAVMQRRQYLIS